MIGHFIQLEKLIFFIRDRAARLNIARTLCRMVKTLWDQGIVHRDLKADNVQSRKAWSDDQAFLNDTAPWNEFRLVDFQYAEDHPSNIWDTHVKRSEAGDLAKLVFLSLVGHPDNGSKNFTITPQEAQKRNRNDLANLGVGQILVDQLAQQIATPSELVLSPHQLLGFLKEGSAAVGTY